MTDQLPTERGSPRERFAEIRLANLEDIDLEYANLVHATIEPLALQIVFSRLVQPVATTQAEREQWEAATTVDATVVARILMPPSVVEQTIALLQQQMERHRQQFAATPQGSTEGEGV